MYHWSIITRGFLRKWDATHMFQKNALLEAASLVACGLALLAGRACAADNELTESEKKAGWELLFDGKSLEGWMTSSEKPSQRPVEDSALNPHKCGGYMLIHDKVHDNFKLALDFKISEKCNS